jgi:hypothetical protein
MAKRGCIRVVSLSTYNRFGGRKIHTPPRHISETILKTRASILSVSRWLVAKEIQFKKCTQEEALMRFFAMSRKDFSYLLIS